VSAPVATLVSFRLGGPDGVSVEAAKWSQALRELGFRVTTLAGTAPADQVLAGLAMPPGAAEEPPPPPPTDAELTGALAGADLVVVENLLSLPLNPGAASAVARVLAGRPTLVHHHDLPWQRTRFRDWPTPVPDDPRWAHVTINQLSRDELAARGITATTLYNVFDTHVRPGDRPATRAALGIAEDRLLALQPTRAIPRKRIPAALAAAEALDAVFWLLGPAEEGYAPVLDAILAKASVPVLRGPGRTAADRQVADAYAACDFVTFPSAWEGFGNPVIESAVHRRPLLISRYPVAEELARFGFQWFSAEQPKELGRWLTGRDPARPDHNLLDHNLLDHNLHVARTHFDVSLLPERLAGVLDGAGWGWRSW
jgi:glycosyltransferase involved in cell wall biosynthesis